MAFSCKRAERYRARHPLNYPQEPGADYGWFEIRRTGAPALFIQAAGEHEGWEHVSVSCRGRTPDWASMCFVKNLFWDETDVVVQFHPKKSEYVNRAENCLHLWRYRPAEFPTPPVNLV